MLKECANPKCSNVFHGLGDRYLCPRCEKQEDNIYQRIKDYIYENPGATLVQIQEALQMPMEMIVKLYQSGRFQLANNPRCSRCGAIMVSGNSKSICGLCADSLRKQMKTNRSCASQLPSEKKSSSANPPGGQKNYYGIGKERED